MIFIILSSLPGVWVAIHQRKYGDDYYDKILKNGKTITIRLVWSWVLAVALLYIVVTTTPIKEDFPLFVRYSRYVLSVPVIVFMCSVGGWQITYISLVVFDVFYWFISLALSLINNNFTTFLLLSIVVLLAVIALLLYGMSH